MSIGTSKKATPKRFWSRMATPATIPSGTGKTTSLVQPRPTNSVGPTTGRALEQKTKANSTASVTHHMSSNSTGNAAAWKATPMTVEAKTTVVENGRTPELDSANQRKPALEIEYIEMMQAAHTATALRGSTTDGQT